jgi:hypothetical protein
MRPHDLPGDLRHKAIVEQRKPGFLVRLGTALSVVVLAVAAVARAQDLEPRAYVDTPVGMNFLIASYAYSEGGVSTDASLPIQGAELQLNNFVLAYSRSLNVFGKSGKIDLIVPFSQLSGSASLAGQPRERDVTGFGDPQLRFSVNFYGAPALSMKEYRSYRQNVIVGASFQVSAPFSQYDTSKAVNIGTNRWSFKPGLGVSKAIGKFKLELSTGVTFYTNNNDFFGGNTLEQDPIYSVQAHVSYDFGRGVWAGVDGTYYLGARTTINGTSENNMQENSRVGATFALPVNKNNSIKLYVSTGLSTRTGSNFTTGGIAWQYRWGGGL